MCISTLFQPFPPLARSLLAGGRWMVLLPDLINNLHKRVSLLQPWNSFQGGEDKVITQLNIHTPLYIFRIITAETNSIRGAKPSNTTLHHNPTWLSWVVTSNH
jgi:hypothetical protein